MPVKTVRAAAFLATAFLCLEAHAMGLGMGMRPGRAAYGHARRGVVQAQALEAWAMPAAFPPGVDNLPTNLCINGTCVAPTCRYRGGDATTTTWPAWGYGPTLAKTEGGTDVTPNAGSPLGGSSDDSVKFAGAAGDYFQAGDATGCDIANEDFCIGMLARYGSLSATEGLGGKKTSVVNATGYITDANTTVNGRFLLADGTNSMQLNFVAHDQDEWTWLFLCVDDNENSATTGAVSFVNADLDSTANPSSVGSATTSSVFTLGAYSNATNRTTGAIAYFSLWKQSSWFAGGAQNTTDFTAANADLFSKLLGIQPRVNRSQVYTPLTMNRETPAVLRKYNGSTATKLYPVGDDWIRYETPTAAKAGVLMEQPSTNFLWQSQAFNTTWTERDAGDTQSLNSATILAPDGSATADGNIADATDGDHGFVQATSSNLTAATYTFSVYACAGNKNYVYLSDDTVANATVFYDLTACAACTPDGSTRCAGAIGTEGAGVLSGSTYAYSHGPQGSCTNWCRVGFAFTATAASHTFAVQTADDAVSDKTVTGDAATVNTWFWQAQTELMTFPSSPVATTTANVTRNADQYHIDMTGGVTAAAGSLVCSLTLPFNFPNVTACALGEVADNAGANNNNVLIYMSGAPGTLRGQEVSGAVTQATPSGAFTIYDDTLHTVALTWTTNDVRMYGDGVQVGSTDTSGTVPATLTRMGVGYAVNSGCGGLIRECRVYNTPGVTQ